VILDALHDALAFDASDPCAALTWSDWQKSFLADGARFRVARTANQIGKTWVSTADLVMELRGSNPYRARRYRGPVYAGFIGESIQQMSQAGGPLEKLWNMIPPGEVDPRIRFEAGRGICGVKDPVIPFVYGPAAGSVIQIRTYQQRPQSQAGATWHYAYCDEPMPERIYSEVVARLVAHSGNMTCTFTPTPSMPDQAWLRELVTAGVFHEHHATMTERNAWPSGYLRPFLSTSEIEQYAASLPEIERAMRIEASWDPIVTDRWLTGFGPSNVQPFNLHDIPPGALLAVGIDHGLKAGKQAAVLVAALKGEHGRAWVIDEATSDGHTTPEQDARSIIDMLERHGLKYEHVDEWVGDRAAKEGRIIKQKSNGALRRYLAAVAGLPYERTRWIVTPHKYAGSVAAGLRLINVLSSRRDLVVHPRCERFIKACEVFRGAKDDPVKDILDAGRYAIERVVDGVQVGRIKVRAA